MADTSDLISGRSKRQKVDKHGRSAAFEKLKKLKGSKHKYEDSDVDNVYEEVDEREYSRRVLERQDDDWIEDDDGAGYVEDGREIFDDDMDDEAINNASKKNLKGRSNKSSNKLSKEPSVSNGKGCGSIKNMLMNLPAKRKRESTVKIDEDKLLGDIMQELNSSPVLKPSFVSLPSRQSLPTKVMNGTKVTSNVPTARRNVFAVNVEPDILDTPAEPVLVNIGNVKKSAEKEKITLPESQRIEEIDSQQYHVDTVEEDFVIDEMEDSMDEEEIAQISKEAEKEQLNVNKNSETLEKEVKENGLSNNLEAEFEDEMQFEDGMELEDGMQLEEEVPSQPVTVKLEEGTLPLEKSCDGQSDQVLRLFWWDAVEGPPGTVYIFGKVKCSGTYVSCCVTVKNIERQVYLLPREEEIDLKTGVSTGKTVSIMDVYNEFSNEVATQHKIFEFKSRKVLRKYAFDIADVPLSSEYLEVKYPANHGALPRDFSGKTFSRVFGTDTSFLELLLLERRIKGPCWMEVLNAEAAKSPLSWCVVEAVTANPSSIVPIIGEAVGRCGPPPPLTVLSLALRTTLNYRTGQTEVILVSGVVRRDYHLDATSAATAKKTKDESFCILARPDRVPWPKDFDVRLRALMRTPVMRVDSERALLNVFLGKIKSFDPDVVIGHGISDFELEVIVHRLNVLGVSQPSRIGRLRRSLEPRYGKGGFKHKDRFPLSGRLMCDTKVSAKELIKSRSYELQTLCRKVLDGFEEEGVDEQGIVDRDDVTLAFANGTSLAKLMSSLDVESRQILRLLEALNALPLAMEITNIAGNVMSRTLAGGRSERNEFLLLHAFTERGFIVPDKTYGKSAKGEKDSGRREASYAGGLVLEPKVGLYDTLILLMDFNSLYPSIIQEYNICFTTLNRTITNPDKELNDQVLQEMLPDPDTEPGVLPTEIRKLVESRRTVKRLMAAPHLTSAKRRQYDVRQMALKLTANSMYGCLGFSGSRFQAREIAALVTAKGREILSRTRDLVQGKLALKVIYGDTDSVMIDTGLKGDYEAAMKMGSKIKIEVNKTYRQVELDVDGIFERMLLLKKKKYAALILEKKGQELKRRMELKGLDIVRRDWSRLSVDAGKFVVKQLLNEDFQEDDLEERLSRIASFLEALKEELESGKVPLNKLVITKQLTKNPEAYADSKSLPHVQVALRYNAQPGVRPLLQGDTVPYVICSDGTNNAAARRAYYPEELSKGKSSDESASLSVDVHYYLAQQVHPVVSRICEPIAGMDANRIALCLGLDAVFTQKAVKSTSMQMEDVNLPSMPEWNFQECKKFSFTCMNENCKTVNEVDSPYRERESSVSYFLESCSNPDCAVSPLEYLPCIQNELSLAIRKHTRQYYEGWLVCEDPGCQNRVRRIPMNACGSLPVCNDCNSGYMMREYNEIQLYTQLLYYKDMFDLSKDAANKQKPDGKISRDIGKAYTGLKDLVTRILCASSFAFIDLEKSFFSTLKI